MKHYPQLIALVVALNLLACAPDYSPNKNAPQKSPFGGEATNNTGPDDNDSLDQESNDSTPSREGISLSASIGTTLDRGAIPLETQFTCQGQGGVAPMTYRWDFGDGNTSTQQNPTHTYQREGGFTSTCTITDADGRTASATQNLKTFLCDRGTYEGDYNTTQFPGHTSATLQGYTTLAGSLFYVEDPNITQDEFACLTSIQGVLLMEANNELKNVDQFASLTEVVGEIFLLENPALENIRGFSSLRSVASNVIIYDHPSLTSLDGLQGLTHIGHGLQIEYCDALTNVDELSSLQSFDEDGSFLTLSNNDNLSNLNGLSTLMSFRGSVDIANNSALCQNDVDSWIQRLKETEDSELILGDVTTGNTGTCP